jgi:hypothetical protein
VRARSSALCTAALLVANTSDTSAALKPSTSRKIRIASMSTEQRLQRRKKGQAMLSRAA